MLESLNGASGAISRDRNINSSALNWIKIGGNKPEKWQFMKVRGSCHKLTNHDPLQTCQFLEQVCGNVEVDFHYTTTAK